MEMDSVAPFLTSLRTEEAKQPLADDSSKEIQPKFAQSHSLVTEAHGRAFESLAQLSRLMETPEVIEELSSFRSINQSLMERVEILASYKEMHDLLHQLEFTFYEPLKQEIRRVSHEGEFPEYLLRLEVNLQFIIDKAQEITQRPLFRSNERLITALMRARTLLLSAIHNADTQVLMQSAHVLDQVISVEPYKINALIVATFHDMQIHPLVAGLEKLHSALAGQDKTSELANGLAVIIDRLKEFTGMLDKLIWQHDELQQVDATLRLIEASPDDIFSELEVFRPQISRATERLYNSAQTAWGQSLKAAGDELQAALDNGEAQVQIRLHRYRHLVSLAFYRVDFELLTICNDLRSTLGTLQQLVI